MAEGGRIRKNWGLAFASQSLRLLTNTVIFVGVARAYGPSEFGAFAAAHTIAVLFLLLADFGFDAMLASEMSRDRSRTGETAPAFLSLKFLLAAGSTLLMICVAFTQGGSILVRELTFMFSAFVLFSTLTNFGFSVRSRP